MDTLWTVLGCGHLCLAVLASQAERIHVRRGAVVVSPWESSESLGFRKPYRDVNGVEVPDSAPVTRDAFEIVIGLAAVLLELGSGLPTGVSH
jgi:hypothetical protein